MSGRGLNGLSLQQHRALSDAFDGVLGKDPIGWFCVGRLGRRYSGKTVYSLFCRDLVTPGEGVIHGRKRVDITAKGRKVLNGEEGDGVSQQTKVLPITGDPEAVASLRKHLEREGVPVRIFDGPDELVDRYFVHETGVITDRQLHHFYPADKYPPPQCTALLVALDDPDWPDEYVTEFGEFSKGPFEQPRWIYIGGDEIEHRVAYWAWFPSLPRNLPRRPA